MYYGTVMEFLDQAYREGKNRIAVADERGCVTYGQLWKETQNVAFAIGKWKISRKPIIVLSERDRRCITLFWGILYSGNFLCAIKL